MLCGKDGNVRLLRSRTTVCSETHAEIGPARSWLKEWTLGFLKTVGSGAPTDAPTDALRLPTTRMCVCVCRGSTCESVGLLQKALCGAAVVQETNTWALSVNASDERTENKVSVGALFGTGK